MVLLACESMRSFQGGRKAVSNPFFPLNIYSIILLKQVEHANATENWKFFGIHSLQSPLVHQFWDLSIHRLLAPFNFMMRLLAPFNFMMMASNPAATSATEASDDVWLLIHGENPQDKQFSFL